MKSSGAVHLLQTQSRPSHINPLASYERTSKIKRLPSLQIRRMIWFMIFIENRKLWSRHFEVRSCTGIHAWGSTLSLHCTRKSNSPPYTEKVSWLGGEYIIYSWVRVPRFRVHKTKACQRDTDFYCAVISTRGSTRTEYIKHWLDSENFKFKHLWSPERACIDQCS